VCVVKRFERIGRWGSENQNHVVCVSLFFFFLSFPLKHTVRGRPRPHLPEFDEIQDHFRLSSSGFLACMDKDQGGRFNAFFFSIFSSVGLSFF
jgi:hypothetical protein